MATYAFDGSRWTWSEQHLYGAERLGVIDIPEGVVCDDESSTTTTTNEWSGYLEHDDCPNTNPLHHYHHFAGSRRYEITNHTSTTLSDHLGNVMVVINELPIIDASLGFQTADVVSATDYYPFGLEMVGRTFSAGAYDFGFNTQMESPEILAGHTTAMYWEYDARIGRRWELDPKTVTGWSGYACFMNSPIAMSDVMGDEPASLDKKSKKERRKARQEKRKARQDDRDVKRHQNYLDKWDRKIETPINNIWGNTGSTAAVDAEKLRLEGLYSNRKWFRDGFGDRDDYSRSNRKRKSSITKWNNNETPLGIVIVYPVPVSVTIINRQAVGPGPAGGLVGLDLGSFPAGSVVSMNFDPSNVANTFVLQARSTSRTQPLTNTGPVFTTGTVLGDGAFSVNSPNAVLTNRSNLFLSVYDTGPRLVAGDGWDAQIIVTVFNASARLETHPFPYQPTNPISPNPR
jgi:hypothetical protein